MNMVKRIICLVVLLGVGKSAFALNTADLTGTYRYTPRELYKIVYDGGPRWLFAMTPLKEDLALYLYGWQNEEGTVRKGDLRLIRRFSPNFDAGLVTRGKWSNEKFVPRQDLMFDFHTERVGLGVILPFQSEYDIKIGPRVYFGDLSAYLTLSEKKDHLVGLSYVKEGVKFELAYGKEDVWYFKTSKGFKTNFGKVVPELRIKVTPDKNFFGIGIGFLF